nr:LOW QUALITY PROTEIN: immunoglobulin alpha-2 heavy chain-like [Caretta caretta]
MKSLLLFLSLLSALSCVLSQMQLVQSSPGAAKPGETLTCAVSGISISAQNSLWHWIRQPPRKELEWMGYVYTYKATSSLQGRATISGDTAKNQVSLQLRSLTATDTARYYCARDTVTRGRAGLVQKGGTVSKQPSVLAQVQPVQSGPGTVKPGETLTLTCAVSGVAITDSSYGWDWIRQPPGTGLEWPQTPLPSPRQRPRDTEQRRDWHRNGKRVLNSLLRLVQFSPGAAKPGETLTLTCAVSGFSITSSGYGWDWSSSPPHKGLEWLGCLVPGAAGPVRPGRGEETLTLTCAVSGVSITDRSCVLSRVQLVQSGPRAVKPGETLTLTCVVSGVSSSAQMVRQDFIPARQGMTFSSDTFHTEAPVQSQAMEPLGEGRFGE